MFICVGGGGLGIEFWLKLINKERGNIMNKFYIFYIIYYLKYKGGFFLI